MGTEIQDFAALLRGLKQRSGLSYGALAQKLHMSTSTIHRYCNGEAIPHDYAPVERFARVCRASADELVTLHRQWILADEAKRRGSRKAEAAGAFEPSLVTSELASSPPYSPQPSPQSEGATEAESEPEAESQPEAEAEPEARSGSGSGTAPEPAVAEDVTPDARGAAPAPARGRLSGKRLHVLLAAVAVVALTVPAALAINHFSDDRTREEGMDTPRSSAPASPTRSASTSPSPSPSKPSPSASSGSATPSATATKSTTPKGGGAKGGEGAGYQGVPVAATISSYNWDSPCGQYYLLDRDPKSMPPVPEIQDRRSWAARLGGVDGGDMLLELTLQGASQQAVVLKSLQVRVVSQAPANDWPAYSMGEGCGGGIVPQTFDIDLDEAQPVSHPVAGEDAGKVVPAKNFPYQVSSTDVEVFHINAHTESSDVTWYLEMGWSSGGRSGTMRIDDNGKPFRTASMRDRPVYSYFRQTGTWDDISESLEGQGN
ncbi:helix-turn-helix transcriptional regulator [Streptomyces sp. NPDC005786]|uniref:helix-turn-helix domain-containing protein n=1 Tax=Streptomyces sp. NPDC005786 TaxID=3154891 RepID=UPI0033C6B6EF